MHAVHSLHGAGGNDVMRQELTQAIETAIGPGDGIPEVVQAALAHINAFALGELAAASYFAAVQRGFQGPFGAWAKVVDAAIAGMSRAT